MQKVVRAAVAGVLKHVISPVFRHAFATHLIESGTDDLAAFEVFR